jgi:AcrR family transcriptional regulator
MAKRGRPPGRTDQGEATRQALYDAAIARFASDGYEATTLRAIADDAGVSPGLLYRYFPSKQAVVLALYQERSAAYAASAVLPAGGWPPRIVAALRHSLVVLGPHRAVLAAVLPALLADAEGGLLSPAAAGARADVEGVFHSAVKDSSMPPPSADAMARLAYGLQLLVILFWVLDRSEAQGATDGLLGWLERAVPMASMGLWLPGVPELLTALDGIVWHGLEGASAGPTAS